MVDVVRVACSTAPSGTFNIAGGGTEDPVGAMFYAIYATADDTIADHAVFSWGAADGTSEFCISVKNEHNQGSVDSDRIRDTSSCIFIHDLDGGYDGRFSFNTWIAGGVTLNIDDQAPSGFLIKAFFFYPADVANAKVVQLGLGSTTSKVDHTSIDFELDAMWTGHCYTSSTANNVHSPLALGIVYNDNATTPSQKSMSMCGDNGGGAGDQNVYVDSTHGLCATLVDTLRWQTTFSDIDSTGISTTNTGSTSTEVGCFAIKLAAGVSFNIYDITWPTSGNYSVSGLGFEPAAGGLFSAVGPTGFNSFSTASPCVGWSVVSFDDTNIYSNNVTDEDGAATTVCKSLSSDQLRLLDSDGSTDAVLASSFVRDSDGWTATLSTNPTAAVYGFGWAISRASAGSVSLVIQDASQAQSADNVTLTQANQLAVSDTTQQVNVDALALVQANTLTVSDSGHVISVDNLVLTPAISLAVNGALHGVSVDSIALAQANVLSVLDALHSVVSDNVALSQSNQLSVDDAAQGSAVDNVVLQTAGVLSVADALQQSSSGSVVLTQANILVAADTVSSQSSDNLTLSNSVNLTVQESTQTSSVDSVVLTAADVLAVLDAAQTVSVDPIALVQSGTLVVSDSLHAQLVDSISLVLPGSTVVPGSRVCVVESAGRQIVVINSSRTHVVH